ncbi:MAG: hypothetical protein J1E95_09590 [Muribaculaceae bacterium]|nr:hypothetical protein [Muribaculaceae bacterium]
MEPVNTSASNFEAIQNLKSAVVLSPLQLNNIRLDVKHTVLTPDYLENLINSKK